MRVLIGAIGALVLASAGLSCSTTCTPAGPNCAALLTCVHAPGPELMPFRVYVDDADERNHFIPDFFFGDSDDLSLTTHDRAQPRSGTTSIKIVYTPRGTQRFAGIYWRCPVKNLGDIPNAGFNLSGATTVRFWARSSTPGRAEFKVGGLGWLPSLAAFRDSLQTTETNPIAVDLDTTWRQFSIDVSAVDRSYVIGGFLFSAGAVQNPNGLTVFLDDIVWQ